MNSPTAAFHPSNLLTYASLTAGLGAIAAAFAGSIATAGALLALAALCDTFDGRFARRFTRSSELQTLGAQLDSLSDAVAFGVAPVVATTILLGSGPGGARALWWLAAGVYTACTLARLAFYNVAKHDDRFVGVPAPAAALVWSTALAFNPGPFASAAIAASLAFGMVAPVAIPRPGHRGMAIFACWPVALMVVHVAHN